MRMAVFRVSSTVRKLSSSKNVGMECWLKMSAWIFNNVVAKDGVAEMLPLPLSFYDKLNERG